MHGPPARKTGMRIVLKMLLACAALAGTAAAAPAARPGAAAAPSAAPAAAFAGAAAAPAAPLSPLKRVELYAAGMSLLDDGENAKAASFFERILREHPGFAEMTEGLIEARSRQCAPARAIGVAVQGLKSLSGTDHEIFKSYLDGARARNERKFKDAAASFRAAAVAASGVSDFLSAAVCRRAEIMGLIATQDARGTLEPLREMRAALSRSPASDRLLVDAMALEAQRLDVADSLAAADSLYRAALSRAEAEGYRMIEGLCLAGLGRIEDKRQRAVEAEELYARALVLERAMGDPEKTAALLNGTGQMEIRAGQFDAAERHLAEAQTFADSCGQKWILGYVYYGFGALAEARGDKNQALQYFEKSVASHRELGNTWGELGARLRVGYIHSTTGEYTKAIEHYEYALKAYEEMKNLYGLSWTLGGLALAYHKLGDFVLAEEYYRRTLDIRRELGDERGAAWCLNSIGMIADMRGRYRDALSYDEAALAIYEKTGDRVGLGTAQFTIGSVYFYVGDYAEALKHYELALALAEQANDQVLLGKVVSGMGSAYSSAGRLDLAETLDERCLAIARKSKEESEIVWALNNLASLASELGDNEKARGCLDEALRLLPGKGQDYLRARTLYLLGRSSEPGARAMRLMKDALALADTIGLEELKWRCLSDLGELSLAMGDTAESRAYQDRAIETVESLRRLAGADELERHFLEPAIPPYERIVSLILNERGDARDVKEAFGYTERCRAQVLASLLREAMDRGGRTGDEKALEREREIISRLTFYQARLQNGVIPSLERSDLLGKIEALENSFVNLRLQLERDDRTYTSALYPKVERPEDLLSALAPGECMLSYFLGEKSSFVFCGTSRELKVFRLPPRAAIEERVGEFLSLLQQSAPGGAASSDSARRSTAEIPRQVLEEASSELYALVIGPTAREISPAERLVIVPDGLLNRLPFALLLKDGRYLVQDHEISYAPSLRTLRYLRERDALHRRSRHLPLYNIVAIGCSGESPIGSGRTPRVYPFTNVPIEPLPFAADEAREVASIFPKALVLTGATAGESVIKSIPLDDTGILHIAAHAYIDDEDLRRSFIVVNPEQGLSDTLANPFEDGILQWHEVAGLRLNAALVTLSACRSAGGILSKGEGITGFSQAFLYSGAGCVVAAQLDVPDNLAREMMVAYYRGVRSGLGAAAALRAAQLSAIQGGGLAEPSVWGAFAAIGDGNSTPRLSRTLSPTSALALVLLALAAAAILINLFRHRHIF